MNKEYYADYKEAIKRASLISKQGWDVTVSKKTSYIVEITDKSLGEDGE